jgi:hypothetical protein
MMGISEKALGDYLNKKFDRDLIPDAKMNDGIGW